jgi:hypothetical protein
MQLERLYRDKPPQGAAAKTAIHSLDVIRYAAILDENLSLGLCSRLERTGASNDCSVACNMCAVAHTTQAFTLTF